ncbi:hypothetical protein [Fluviicola taffensis]|uniref:Beta-carotene 15,15'-monooxygenase n=1 Tax=Fluviicola taffensis (strain DSM 16823 / NCIMB 13979 / RW262) TaxID=755732 RepID=F2IIB6_FLUTR|nr:hypothetical protein [Fluviicola taffensis]AEA43825.1 hypothetical protein Fluta_1838 [Fluviicola taffensis DSM 16823]
MILRPFLGNRPLVLLLLIPLVIGFQLLNAHFKFHALIDIVDLGLWGKTTVLSHWWTSIVASVIVLANALQLNFLFNQHEFLDKNNYGPSLFYVVLMSFSHSFYQVDSVLICHVLLLQAVRLLFRLKSSETNLQSSFNSVLFIGLSASFLPPSAALIVPFWFSAWALHPFSFRQWLLMIIGFLIPVGNGLAYWWISGHSFSTRILRHSSMIKYEDVFFYGTTATIVILFLLSIIGIQIRLRVSNIRFKKLNRSLVWILIGTLLLGVAEIIFYQQSEWISLLFIPLAFFFTFAFIHRIWQRVASIFFYVTLILAVAKFFLISYMVV